MLCEHRGRAPLTPVVRPLPMTRLLVAVAASMVLAACGCGGDFRSVAKDRAELLSGFESYMSRAELMKQLAERSDVSIVPDPNTRSPRDTRPPFEMITVELSAFEHLNHKGSLHITLFNDRLLGMWFYPEHPETYLDALRASGVILIEDQEVVTGNVVMRQSKDYRERLYVAWEDKRLGDESNRWIRCYA